MKYISSVFRCKENITRHITKILEVRININGIENLQICQDLEVSCNNNVFNVNRHKSLLELSLEQEEKHDSGMKGQ